MDYMMEAAARRQGQRGESDEEEDPEALRVTTGGEASTRPVEAEEAADLPDLPNFKELSDSSDDEHRNTIGNVPLEWYKHEDHIGEASAAEAAAKSPVSPARRLEISSPFFIRLRP